jgi:hypothetical protein
MSCGVVKTKYQCMNENEAPCAVAVLLRSNFKPIFVSKGSQGPSHAEPGLGEILYFLIPLPLALQFD